MNHFKLRNIYMIKCSKIRLNFWWLFHGKIYFTFLKFGHTSKLRKCWLVCYIYWLLKFAFLDNRMVSSILCSACVDLRRCLPDVYHIKIKLSWSTVNSWWGSIKFKIMRERERERERRFDWCTMAVITLRKYYRIL